MKYNLKTFFICILYTVILTACNNESKRYESLLNESQSLLDTNPDSALLLLNSIHNPQELGTERFNKYQLLRIQAKDKAYIDISADTMIFDLSKYYIDKGDKENAAIALFYSGRLMQDRQLKEQAMHLYLDAKTYVQQTSNNNLKGLIDYFIGELNYNQYQFGEALPFYQESHDHFMNANKPGNAISALNRLSMCHLLEMEIENAFKVGETALEIAQERNDSVLMGDSYVSIAVAYQGTERFDKAREYYRKTLDCYKDSATIAKIYLNIANCFSIEKGEKDSCVYYTTKSMEMLGNDSTGEKLRLPLMLSKIEEKDGNYKEALALYKKYMEELTIEYDNQRSKSVLDIQQKYDFELMKNENNRLIIHRQYLMLLGAALLIILLIIFMIIRKRQRETKKNLMEAKEHICQLNEMAETYQEEKRQMQEEHKELTAIAETYNQKKIVFKEILYEHFDILKKAALLEGYLRDDEKKKGEKLLKKFNEVVYNQDKIDWDMIFKTMNHLYDNIVDILEARYPELDESELKIFCLTYADLNNTEISIILRLSVNTVQARKSSIRRKLGIDGYGNIVDFMKADLNHP